MAKKDDQNQEPQARRNNGEDHPGYVEAKDGEGNTVRAMSKPPNSLFKGAMQAAPDDDYAGLEAEAAVTPSDVDTLSESMKQQEQNFPRIPEDYFDPREQEVPEPRHDRAATHRSDFGRVVVVDYDCVHDGEVYKAGTQDLPLDVADALIAEGVAFEPAGKQKGR